MTLLPKKVPVCQQTSEPIHFKALELKIEILLFCEHTRYKNIFISS